LELDDVTNRKFPTLVLKEMPHTAQAKDLELAGFHSVQLTSFAHWSTVHEWCREKFGDEYTWTGSTFWFTNWEDATEFALTWC
jgi:hypothetical protein